MSQLKSTGWHPRAIQTLDNPEFTTELTPRARWVPDNSLWESTQQKKVWIPVITHFTPLQIACYMSYASPVHEAKPIDPDRELTRRMFRISANSLRDLILAEPDLYSEKNIKRPYV